MIVIIGLEANVQAAKDEILKRDQNLTAKFLVDEEKPILFANLEILSPATKHDASDVWFGFLTRFGYFENRCAGHSK